MSKLKKILVPVIFILISVTMISLGFSELKLIPDFNLGDILNIPAISFNQIKSNSEIITDLTTQYSAVPITREVPDGVNAVFLDINSDYNKTAADGTDAVKYAVYSDFDFYRNFMPDIFFVKPDENGLYSGLYEPDGTVFDVFGYTAYYVRSLDCKLFLVADEALLYDSLNRLTMKNIEKYISTYNIDGLLLSFDTIEGQSAYTEAVRFFSDELRKNYPSLIFGVEASTDYTALYADEFVTAVASEELTDYIYVEIDTTVSDTEHPFASVALWWNSFAQYYDVPLYCEHRADKVFTPDPDWQKSDEISKQVKLLYPCPYFDGSVYYSGKALKNKISLSRELAIHINDVDSSNSGNFVINSVSLNDNQMTFEGTVSYSYMELFLNNESVKLEKIPVKNEASENAADETEVQIQKIIFSESLALRKGMNEFTFFASGGSQTYSVYNNINNIHTYYPVENISAEENTSFVFYASCPENSAVFAIFNGNSYQMVADGSVAFENMPAGFSVYSCEISVAEGIRNKEVSLFCSYQGEASSVNCFIVNPSGNSVVSNSKTTVLPLSCYSDNSLGTALMCEVKTDNAEQIDKDSFDTYQPTMSSLSAGTIDYVKSIGTRGGYVTYDLESGITLYGDDCILINNGYKLPLNNITLKSYEETSDNECKFIFSADWFSPVEVNLQPLNYASGYLNYGFNINEFNAQYVDITFHHTDKISFTSDLIFSSASSFISYELYDSSDDTIVLRLYLKNYGEFYGFDIKNEQNGEISVSFKKNTNFSVQGKTVMIDAGHGGLSMVGTALNDNSVSEAEITLGIAYGVKKYLEAMGANVIMTRLLDSSLTLSERTYKCETLNPDMFVSIHCDGVDAVSESGTHTFYYKPYSQPLASAIHNRMVEAYKAQVYLPIDANYEKIDRKIKYYPFFVTRVDNCPSVLVETGFLTNEIEGHVLADSYYQDVFAKAIADGIADFYK